MNKTVAFLFSIAFLAVASRASAQTTMSWTAPKVTGATDCNKAAEVKYADLQEGSKQKAAFDKGKCVPIATLKKTDATREVCNDGFAITYVDVSIFPAFNGVVVDSTTLAGMDENYAYPVALCDTGKLCVACSQGGSGTAVNASQGATEPAATGSALASGTTATTQPPATATKAASATNSATPVSGALENTILLLMIGGLAIGLGSYHLIRNKA